MGLAARAGILVEICDSGLLLSPFHWLAAALVAARNSESVSLLATHCDQVPGNVLVSAHGRLWIVDWDDAGPWNAAEEVSAAVVSWSSGATGAPIERIALAMVEGYRSAGGIFGSNSPTVSPVR